MKIKRLSALLLSLGFVFSLCGCETAGSSENGSEQNGTSQSQTEETQNSGNVDGGEENGNANGNGGNGSNGGNGGNGGETVHTHTWGAWSTTPATCLEAGKKVRSCDCGDKEEQTIEKLRHTYSTTECTACHTPLIASNGLTFRFYVTNESYTVSLLYCTAEEIVIPATYEGLPVVFVDGSLYDKGNNTVGTNTTTKHIYIPEGVKNFEFGMGYDVLESISLPSTIEEIPTQGLFFVGMDTFTTIYYGGTAQEWIALKKGMMWYHGTLTTVVTSDGVRRNLDGSMQGGGLPSIFG